MGLVLEMRTGVLVLMMRLDFGLFVGLIGKARRWGDDGCGGFGGMVMGWMGDSGVSV